MKEKFGIKDQLGYIAGDMAGSFVNLTFDAFFLLFTTYVLNISAGFMSLLFLYSRLFDAVNDPIIGSFPDRYKLGKGTDKFKPYIKLMMWPLAISILLGFYDISKFGVSDTFKYVWVSFAYLLYGVSYTGTSMPFGAMLTVITKDLKERSKLSFCRAIGGSAVGFGFLAIVPKFIWDKNNNPNPNGYFIVAIIAALGCIIGYTLLMNLTKERYSFEKKETTEQYKFFDVVKQAFKNRPLIGIMVASIGSLIYITGNGQFGAFIYKEYYKLPKMQMLAMYLQIPVILSLFYIMPKIQKKIDKRKIVLYSLVFNFVLSLILFIKPIANVYTFIVLYVIANIGQTIFIMTVWAFVSDAIDYHELKFKNRSDGTLYSIYTFSRKIGTTLASFGTTAILAAIGFSSVKGAQQTPEVIEAIRYLGTGIPLVAVIIEIIGLKFIFNLNEEKGE